MAEIESEIMMGKVNRPSAKLKLKSRKAAAATSCGNGARRRIKNVTLRDKKRTSNDGFSQGTSFSPAVSARKEPSLDGISPTRRNRERQEITIRDSTPAGAPIRQVIVCNPRSSSRISLSKASHNVRYLPPYPELVENCATRVAILVLDRSIYLPCMFFGCSRLGAAHLWLRHFTPFRAYLESAASYPISVPRDFNSGISGSRAWNYES
jgi:hypothetical protein